MKIYASKYRVNASGYDSEGQYYGHMRYTQLYYVRVETKDNPLGFGQIVRVDDYVYPNKMLREQAIKQALPDLKYLIEKESEK